MLSPNHDYDVICTWYKSIWFTENSYAFFPPRLPGEGSLEALKGILVWSVPSLD